MNHYVINLTDVKIKRAHPFTLYFTGYVPVYSNGLPYTFIYDGEVFCPNLAIPDTVKKDFEKQLNNDYGLGMPFNLSAVKKQLKNKNQYKMKI